MITPIAPTRWWLAATAAVLLLSVQTVLADSLREQLRHRLEFSQLQGELRVNGDNVHAAEALRRFYGERSFAPAWINSSGANAAARELLAVLAAAHEHGLRPDDYHLSALQQRLASWDQRDGDHRRGLSVDLELLFSDALLMYATHMLAGRINPQSIDPEWFAEMRGGDIVAIAQRALAAGRLRSELAALAPRDPGYRALQQALAQWRERAHLAPTLPPIAGGAAFKPGAQDPRVPALRRRLGLEPGDSTDYDAELVAAVVAFQQQRGLENDGVVGPMTLAELNRSAADIVDTLILNLERWRWLPASLGERHILVNIADFRLRYVTPGREPLEMKVVVGKAYRRTPVFSARMTYAVLNPYWEVPPSIAVRDLLPKIRKDPDFLQTQGFELLSGWGAQQQLVDASAINWRAMNAANFRYRLRQRPGPLNALGRVKFMLPNPFSVYLHDTPATELFTRNVRSFSSGCIRLEKPRELFAAVAEHSHEWPEGSAPARINHTVSLQRALPVHLLYWTAWVDAHGELQLRPDIYQRDQRLLTALRQPAP